MADPLSIATGAITLAGTGIKIVEGLKSYVDTVRKAEERLKPLQHDVQFMADLLKEVGILFETETIRNLCTQRLFDSAKSACDSCEEGFKRVQDFIAAVATIDGNDMSLSADARFKYYFKQKEMDLLQQHFDRSKASLDLVFSILQVAIVLRTAPKESILVEDRKSDLQRKMKAEKEAGEHNGTSVRTEAGNTSSSDEALVYNTEIGPQVKSTPALPCREPSHKDSLPTATLLPSFKGLPNGKERARGNVAFDDTMEEHNTHASSKHKANQVSSSRNEVNNQGQSRELNPDDRSTSLVQDFLLRCLESTEQEAADLAQKSRTAIDLRRDRREYDSRTIHDTFRRLSTALNALRAQEEKEGVPNTTSAPIDSGAPEHQTGLRKSSVKGVFRALRDALSLGLGKSRDKISPPGPYVKAMDELLHEVNSDIDTFELSPQVVRRSTAFATPPVELEAGQIRTIDDGSFREEFSLPLSTPEPEPLSPDPHLVTHDGPGEAMEMGAQDEADDTSMEVDDLLRQMLNLDI